MGYFGIINNDIVIREGSVNYVPAAAVIHMILVLPYITEHKAPVDSESKLYVKF